MDGDYCSQKEEEEEEQSPLSSYSSSFKVLVMLAEYKNGHWRLSPYSFSSSGSSWTRPHMPFHIMERSIVVQTDVLACRGGKVHWFVRDVSGTCNLYTFGLGREAIHVGITKLSVPVPLDRIEVGSYNPLRLNVTVGGKLSLLILHRKCLKVEIWTHED
jgi:hypothetical protein